ncbi:MAG: lipid-A-disaccharide synthase N-terminal domain-containing protein [Phycisphaeraceae bacterium]|nr:lipid-A-disaccharide synthase N-terminal domain-containing protein [Phycisphaeraceae bacterium]
MAAIALPSDNARSDSSSPWFEVKKLKDLPSNAWRAKLRVNDQGHAYYHVVYRDGRRDDLTPQAYADALYQDQKSRGWIFRLFNISNLAGVAWVSIGFLGQTLFAGRMIVQWLASEKSRKSVVPVAFWWMSLLGSLILTAYFVWRWDIVGFLGQAPGWIIYARNLMLIYRPHHAAPDAKP